MIRWKEHARSFLARAAANKQLRVALRRAEQNEINACAELDEQAALARERAARIAELEQLVRVAVDALRLARHRMWTASDSDRGFARQVDEALAALTPPSASHPEAGGEEPDSPSAEAERVFAIIRKSGEPLLFPVSKDRVEFSSRTEAELCIAQFETPSLWQIVECEKAGEP